MTDFSFFAENYETPFIYTATALPDGCFGAEFGEL